MGTAGSSKGVRAGFEGRAAGGKTINETLKQVGVPPKAKLNSKENMQDKWTPNLERPER